MKGNLNVEIMKKAIKSIFAVLAIAVSVAACTPKTESTATETKDSVATETVAPAEADTTQAPVATDSTAAH